ncbi:glutathione S-transferase [Mycena vitilis]|nr:glutathione S-transferase [Mycena vitilis]
MSILKLYGDPQAACTRRAATVLHELHIPFELIPVDLANSEHKTAAYLEKHPFGKVPYIDDDGFILYETRAIGRYLVAKNPSSGLIPTEIKANAIFEQAASAELTNFDPHASKLTIELWSKKCGFSTKSDPVVEPTPPHRKFSKFYKDAAADPAVVEAQDRELDKVLDAYDRILAKHRYVAGDTLTLADLFHLPLAAFITVGGSDIMTRRPNVARWYNELVARPSWLAYMDGVETTAVY